MVPNQLTNQFCFNPPSWWLSQNSKKNRSKLRAAGSFSTSQAADNSCHRCLASGSWLTSGCSFLGDGPGTWMRTLSAAEKYRKLNEIHLQIPEFQSSTRIYIIGITAIARNFIEAKLRRSQFFVILRALKQISKSSTANVPVNINKTQPNRFLFWPFFQQISRLQEPSTTYPSPSLSPSPTTRRQGLSAIGFLNLCRTRSRSHTQDLPGSVPQGPGAMAPVGGFLSQATNFGPSHYPTQQISWKPWLSSELTNLQMEQPPVGRVSIARGTQCY